MSSSARDIRYGRRGGGWASHDRGVLLAELQDVRARCQADGTWPEPLDAARIRHPDTIAKARAHDRTCRRRHDRGEDCPAVADPGDIQAIWDGRARMATARQNAGQPLDDLDHEALHRRSTP